MLFFFFYYFETSLQRLSTPSDILSENENAQQRNVPLSRGVFRKRRARAGIYVRAAQPCHIRVGFGRAPGKRNLITTTASSASSSFGRGNRVVRRGLGGGGACVFLVRLPPDRYMR